MTPPVFLIDADAAAEASAGSVVRLSGPEGRHAATVRRLAAGEAVTLVDGRGRRLEGTVAGIAGKQDVDVEVVRVTTEPAPDLRVTVVQALPKGERGEVAVELLTEIGVDRIVPWSATNCVTKWRGDRAQKSHRRWEDAAVAAGKQSRRARFPEVGALAGTDVVGDIVMRASLAVVLDEGASTPIGSVAVPSTGEIVVVVGPEGGLTPAEVDGLVSAGALAVRLGPTVLRTSSAGLAAVSALLVGSDRWEIADASPGVMGG